MKHIFIVNPTSGGGKPATLISVIHEYFKDKKEPYEILLTERNGIGRFLLSPHIDIVCVQNMDFTKIASVTKV